MIATLKFKLNKEKRDFQHAVNGYRYAQCLKDIYEYFKVSSEVNSERAFSSEFVEEFIKSNLEEAGILRDEL